MVHTTLLINVVNTNSIHTTLILTGWCSIPIILIKLGTRALEEDGGGDEDFLWN